MRNETRSAVIESIAGIIGTALDAIIVKLAVNYGVMPGLHVSWLQVWITLLAFNCVANSLINKCRRGLAK